MILLLSYSYLGYGQTNDFEIIPQEDVEVNTNSNLFVVGETLYYKLHCYNETSKTLSTISKIIYAVLISDQKEIVFSHKLHLDKGLAYGDFYIPPHIKTGNYKLVSYTNWMNNKQKPFEEFSIYIINPFSKISERYYQDDYMRNAYIDSIILKNTNETKRYTTDKRIWLDTDKDTYMTRSKVSLELSQLNSFSGNGNYSISVRKVDSVEIVKNNKERKLQSKTTNVFHLPEIRGEIISGIVKSKKDNIGVSNKIVALSIKGNKNIYKNVKTDRQGKFYFNLYENYNSGQIVVQVIDPDNDTYKIVLDDPSFKNFSRLNFSKLILHPNIENWLLQKSINNQIESAFFSSKKDSTGLSLPPEIFYGEANEEFVLDDYTRFPTTKETFIEVVKGAGIRKIEGARKIVIVNSETEQNDQLPDTETLVLIDGIPVSNHEILLDFNPKGIEKISVVKSMYYYGPIIYHGIVAIETKKRNFSLPYSVPHLFKKITSPLAKKNYFSINYDKQEDMSRIPDFRTQLFWLPQIKFMDTTQTINFYTSDIKGIYEIFLEGYTDEGKYLKLNKFIKVE